MAVDRERPDAFAAPLAYLDREPVGFGRAIVTPRGGAAAVGATLPTARGTRRLHGALVHARWREAVERGTPPPRRRSAGPHRRPILERLGFERIGAVRLLLDRV